MNGTQVLVASEASRTSAATPTADDLVRVLQAPLAVLKAFASMLPGLLGCRSTDAARTTDRTVRRSVERLDHLLTLVATDAALTHGTLELRRQPVDAVALATATVADTALLYEPHPVTVDASGQAMVNADEARVREVLVQLLLNAATFTPGRTPIELAVRCHDGAVTVAVTDRGHGLPPERLEQVFRRGVTFDQSAAGLGLGLYVARAVVEAHGGTVCATDDNPGLQVTVRLPAACDIGGQQT